MPINDDTSVQAGLTDGTDIDMGFVAEQPATKPKKTMRNDPPMVKTPPAAKAKALVQKPSAKPKAKPIPGTPSIASLVHDYKELQKCAGDLAAKENAEAAAKDKIDAAQKAFGKAETSRLAAIQPVLEECTRIAIGVGEDETRREDFLKTLTYTDTNGDPVKLKDRSDRSFEAKLVLGVHPWLYNEQSNSSRAKLTNYAKVVKLGVKEAPENFGGWLQGEHERADGTVAEGLQAAVNRATDEFMSDPDKEARAKEEADTIKAARWFLEKKCIAFTTPAITPDMMEEFALIPAYINHKTHKLYLALHQAKHGRKVFLGQVKNAAKEAAAQAKQAKKK